MNRPKGRTTSSVIDRWFGAQAEDSTQAGDSTQADSTQADSTQSSTLSGDDIFVLIAGTLLTAVVVYDMYRKMRENSGRRD